MANVSPVWYTWLEQGRGGDPSPEVLERIVQALSLSAVEREHVFLIGLGRTPGVRPLPVSVSPQLQRVLDAFKTSPAYLKTAAWEVVAWNHAAAAVLTDYALLAPGERNILRRLFGSSNVQESPPDWEANARFAVAAFRVDFAGAGKPVVARALIEEFISTSNAFRAMWSSQAVRTHGEGTKLIRHQDAGLIELDYVALAVDGQPDLGLVVFNAVSVDDERKIQSLIAAREAQAINLPVSEC